MSRGISKVELSSILASNPRLVGPLRGTNMAGFLSKAELEALVTGSVQTADLAAGAVTTAKVADANITEAKIANGAVTENKVGAGAVTLAKLPDGVLTADVAGRAKVADGFVNNAKVDAAAAIAHTKLGTGTVKATLIAGGAAGDHTVTGITTDDSLVAVLQIDATDASETYANLTAEFSITAANTINNTGGTNTTGSGLLVVYEDRS